MVLRLVQANIKARDDAAVGRFWARALGWVARSVPGATSVAPAGFDWTKPDAPVCVDVVAVPDPETVRYRAYLELAGAPAGGVLADPEGNQFRVREEAGRDTGPIAAIVVCCADPRAMAGFWGAAIGWAGHEISDDQARLRSAAGVGPYLEFRRTADLTRLRHRVHLDVVPQPGGDQAAEVARLRALGATPVDVGQGDASWIVLADPEGNEFCVLAPA